MRTNTTHQCGGSPDFDALWAELRLGWPGYFVTRVYPGSVWSGESPDGERREGMAWVGTLGGWCVEVEEDGFERRSTAGFRYGRNRWFEWGESVRDAADKLASVMSTARQSAHTAALGIDHYIEVQENSSIFRAACPECVVEAEDCGQAALA